MAETITAMAASVMLTITITTAAGTAAVTMTAATAVTMVATISRAKSQSEVNAERVMSRTYARLMKRT